MIDSEITAFIRREIRRELNIILSGSVKANTSQTEDIDAMFPGMAAITKRPVMHPYGLVSRAPTGTISVVGQQGDHTGNRIVLGHRDKDREELDNEGEVTLYDANGHSIQMKESSMAINSAEKELFEVMIRFLTTLINARTNTIFGPQPLIADPAGIPNRETFFEVRSDLIAMKGE
jgi:phage gp45-like